MGKMRKLWVAVCAIMAVLVWLPFVGIDAKAGPLPSRTETVTIQPGDDVTLKPNFDVLSRYGVTEDTEDLTYEWFVTGEQKYTGSIYERKNVKKAFYCELMLYSKSFVSGYYIYGFNVVIDNDLSAKAISDTEITLKAGDTATLKVQASCAKGDITYVWEGQGSVSADNPAEFTTAAVTKSTSVYCHVSDMYGNTETIYYYINIENGLKASAKGSSKVNVPYNEKATLEVEASCNEGELTYAWLDIATYDVLGSGAVFTTESVTGKKIYRCQVSDKYDNIEFVDFTVNVDNGLKVEAVGSTNVIIKQGESVILKVKASCNEGGLTYKWTELTDNSISEDEAATDSITVTYNSNTEISYNTYTCEVTDKYGNSEEISFTVGSYNPSDMSDTSKVYVISYNEEVKRILGDMLSKRSDLKGKIAFINLRMGGTDPDYLKGVDLVLEKNPDATFIVAGDASMLEDINDRNKYLTVDELGLTSAYSAAYPYTRKAGTFDGKLTAMAWQANPGTFMYDPDIAQKVLGTSDPEQVQKMIGTADGFLDVAAKMKAAGYYMTSGAANKDSNGDQYYEMLANMAGISVFSDDYGLTDSQKEVAKKIMYGIVANGYDTGHSMWDEKWVVDDTKSGKVFGWFSCTWAAMWSLTFDKPMAVCQGPVPYYWGGTYLFAKSGKADKTAAEILKAVCCDAETMAYIGETESTLPNSAIAAEKLIKNVKSPVSMKNNQNLWKAYDEMAKAIDGGDYKITEPVETPLVPAGSSGIVKGTDGVYYYVEDGVIQTGKTAMIPSGSKTYYVKKGVWQSGASGLIKVGSRTYYLAGGLLQKSKTGFVKAGSSKIYVKNGVRSTYTGFVAVNGSKYYIVSGVFQSSRTGFVTVSGRKYYVVKGVFQSSRTGFVTVSGRKYYVVKGVFQSTKTGFVTISGRKYYVVKGVFQSTKTGLVKPVKTGKTYYIKKGVLQSRFSGNIVYNKHTYKIVKGVMTKKIR